MPDVIFARIGVILAPEDRFAPWYLEALHQSGLVFEAITSGADEELAQFDVILLCGHGPTSFGDFAFWLQSTDPRALVVSGGTWGLEEMLGVTTTSDAMRLTQGTVWPSQNENWPEGAPETRFIGGTRARPELAEVHVSTGQGLVAVSQRNQCYFVAPHIGQTLAMFGLGSAVESDGVGPADGSAIWDEGTPRAEYGTRIPFEDRIDQTFLVPHADIIRELWLRTILTAIAETGKRAVIRWQFPRNATHVGIVTLEGDTNNPSDYFNINANLAMTGTRATVLSQGTSLSADLYGWMRRVGHEVALSYSTTEPGAWHPDRCRIQMTNLTRLASGVAITTVRMTHGAWKGWTQPYEAFAYGGAKAVISKGGTEQGTCGLLFGTCTSFLVHDLEGKPLGIFEMPYQLYNVGAVTPESAVQPIIDAIKIRHGVVHGVTGTSMLHDDSGAAGMRRWVSLLKQSGADFITVERLMHFDRIRRQLRVNLDHPGRLSLSTAEAVEGLTLLVQGKELEASGLVGRTSPQYVRRYGQDFIAFTVNLGDRQQAQLKVFSALAA